MHYFWVTSSIVGICLIQMSLQPYYSSCCGKSKIARRIWIWKRYPSLHCWESLWLIVQIFNVKVHSQIYFLYILPDWQRTIWISAGQFFYSKKRGTSNIKFGMLLLLWNSSRPIYYHYLLRFWKLHFWTFADASLLSHVFFKRSCIVNHWLHTLQNHMKIQAFSYQLYMIGC